ncbi:HD-GYP domain-containing protein [Haliovirga abyssi]|uniref:HD-GYP domain-containing protein n=1 Tax=Haliovirga abyssi TaxID=2996794 RepID=A0AAU9DZT4_9FUSO|nr:HD domain-containing phosphohydrolase [Haliovirga abyssi]BDU51095.1 hypothetical protein HLVA_16640 [Haliovirga abyssi]
MNKKTISLKNILKKYNLLIISINIAFIIIALLFTILITNNNIKKLALNNIINSSNYILDNFDNSFSGYENSFNFSLKTAIISLKKQLNKTNNFSKKNIEKQLNKINKELDVKKNFYVSTLNYYIINPKGKIYITNYPKDLNLNIFNFKSLNMLRDLKTSDILIGKINFEVSSKRFRKFIYTKLNNGDILELGVFLDNSFIENLKSSFSNLKKNNDFITDISFYDSLGQDLFYNKNNLSNKFINKLNKKNIIINKIGFNKYEMYLSWESAYKKNVISSKYYYKINVSLASLNNKNYIIIFILIIFTIVYITIAFFINKTTYKKIAEPFSELTKSMKLFSKDRILNSQDISSNNNIEEFNFLIETYKNMADEITAGFEELAAMNDTLKESYDIVEETNEKMEQLLSVSSSLIEKAVNKDTDFLSFILHTALKLIPEADYGTVYLIKDGFVHYIDAVGHNKKLLNKIHIDQKYFQYGNSSIEIVENILDQDVSFFPKDLFEKIKLASKPIKTTLAYKFKVNDEIVGGMSIDISKNSIKHFSPSSTNIVKAIGSFSTAFFAIIKYINQKEVFRKDIVFSMINLLEIHETYMKGHSQQVADLSLKIAAKMGLDEKTLDEIYWASLVHDIGKIIIPSEILNKKSKLTDEEFEIIKKHTNYAYQVLNKSEFLGNIAKIVLHHHERIDGTGYPEGLHGNNIPLASKIIAVADAWDAMTHERSYKPALSKDKAITEIINNKNRQFDSDIADILIKIIKEKEKI